MTDTTSEQDEAVEEERSGQDTSGSGVEWSGVWSWTGVVAVVQ